MGKTLRSVLIVDDEPLDVRMVEIVLKRAGILEEVWSVTNGKEAIDLFRDPEAAQATHGENFPPDLILLDVNMPVMNGFDFLEAYAALDESEQLTKNIVILSSSNYHKDRERAEAYSQVSDYLVKPISVDFAHQLVERFGS
jgi:CheY-like chemotaxis protein